MVGLRSALCTMGIKPTLPSFCSCVTRSITSQTKGVEEGEGVIVDSLLNSTK